MEVPPYIRRPIIRLAYCTGIRRCACSMKVTAVMTSRTSTITRANIPQPLVVLIFQPSLGSRAAIEVKIRTDMPLPTPRSVISSPSHITTPVPAVIVITRMVRVSQSGIPVPLGTIGNWSQRFWNSCPERASATNAEDWRMPRPRVR